MNPSFIAAAALAFATGLAHSIIGEWLIFQRLRRGGWIPTFGGELLRQRHVRILWASWHLVTIMGWGLAALLLALASAPPTPLAMHLARVIAVVTLMGGAIVLLGTRGRHPGWVAMALVGVLVEWGR